MGSAQVWAVHVRVKTGGGHTQNPDVGRVLKGMRS